MIIQSATEFLAVSRSFANSKLIRTLTSYAMSKGATMDDDSATQLRLDQESRLIARDLSEKGNYKGASGKIGVIGGSLEYTGAPYFAAITALKVGADLVHVFCMPEAAVPIKCYSPELIVHPLLESKLFDDIAIWLKRMDVILIGCGLGRKPDTLKLVERIVLLIKDLKKPLIMDADALYAVEQKPTMLVGFESDVVLTPNRAELARLTGTSFELTDVDVHRLIMRNNWGESITILAKAENDTIIMQNEYIALMNLGGSDRRCGGQGDILGGALAVFWHWSINNANIHNTVMVACYAACKFTRMCNQKAFEKFGRSMTASDMITQTHEVFAQYFERVRDDGAKSESN